MKGQINRQTEITTLYIYRYMLPEAYQTIIPRISSSTAALASLLISAELDEPLAPSSIVLVGAFTYKINDKISFLSLL